MTDIFEAGIPAILPQTLSFTILVTCEILAIMVILWSFISFLDRVPSRFAKIKSKRENLSPLEIFENHLTNILLHPENAKTALPKLVREFLESYSGIPWIQTKTLSEISDILPKPFSPIFSILEEIEYSKNPEFSKKQLEEIIAKLRILAERLITQ